MNLRLIFAYRGLCMSTATCGKNTYQEIQAAENEYLRGWLLKNIVIFQEPLMSWFDQPRRIKSHFFGGEQAQMKQQDPSVRLKYGILCQFERKSLAHFGPLKGCIPCLGDNQSIWELGAE
jgi:hypothetical protein